ncbi:MAG TPA: ethanolamine ammonia-lyase subunit EutC [Chloroflexaceae bacterium]|nr:ethanolamine ammonia-lyase subunit EutC [Chloroflexaceae bacterium]
MADESVERADPWEALRRYTNARIALGRAGDSLPTAPQLAFQLDHARARDAVHLPFDAEGVAGELAAAGLPVILARSAAPDRATYLKRPDLGRRLDADSRKALAALALPDGASYDAVFVIADGLSALAVHRHAAALAARVAAALDGLGWRLAPVVVVGQGRVAVADEVGALLRAEQAAILIGERPGLSVADSLGVYLTYGPRLGRTDAERNCISNIHGRGQSYETAMATLVYLMSEARRLRLTGVELKDDRAGRDAAARLAE